jgi:hypothetical protein
MSDDLILAPVDQTALSVVTLTSVRNGLDALSNDKVFLTGLFFTPVVGATLTICADLVDLVKRITDFITQKVYNQNVQTIVEANQKRKKFKVKKDAKSLPLNLDFQAGSKPQKRKPSKYTLSKLIKKSEATAKSLTKKTKVAESPYSTKTMVLDPATMAAAATEYAEPLPAKKGDAQGKAQTEPVKAREEVASSGAVSGTPVNPNLDAFRPASLITKTSPEDLAAVLGNTTPLPKILFSPRS